MSQLQFRDLLIEELQEVIYKAKETEVQKKQKAGQQTVKYRRGVAAAKLPVAGSHWPKKNECGADGYTKERRCQYCWVTLGVRKSTTLHCPAHDVGLCLEHFEAYHEL